MRTLAVVVALLSLPAFAADYTPWPEANRPVVSETFELAQQGKSCCKQCTKGQPCGNTCISAKAKCKSAPGCAC